MSTMLLIQKEEQNKKVAEVERRKLELLRANRKAADALLLSIKLSLPSEVSYISSASIDNYNGNGSGDNT